jgi:hypothetical protein
MSDAITSAPAIATTSALAIVIPSAAEGPAFRFSLFAFRFSLFAFRFSLFAFRFSLSSLTFNWHSDAASGKVSGPALHLNPFETRRIDVAALQDGKTLPRNAQWASVTLVTNGLPNEVVAVTASYDSTLRYGAQTPFSDVLAAHWAGGQWEYDPQHDSIITTGNGGAKPTLAAFTIFYNQGTQKYQLEQILQPGEQMWMDIGKLIRESVPDKTGKALPRDLTSGSYEVRDLTNKGTGSLFEGKVIWDRTYGHVTYGCAGCCGYINPATPWYNPVPVIINTFQDDGVDAYNTCDSATEDVSDSFYNHWSSGNTAIVTVDYYGRHNGVSAGATTSQTSGQLSMARPRACILETKVPQGGVNVSCPTPTNFTIQSESNLNDGSLFFTYTWSSSTGNQADLANCTVGESVFYPGYPTTPYIWPLPMVQSTPNPTAVSGKGSNSGFTDTNGSPTSYRQPYSSASFNATQRFWWTCPCYQNGATQYFVPDVTISRRTFKDTDGF